MQFSFMIFKEGFHFEILLIITFHFHYVKAENFENLDQDLDTKS